MIEAEIEDELGYSKYDYKNKEKINSRYGYSSKKLQTDNGKIELSVPKDREGEFKPPYMENRIHVGVKGEKSLTICLYSIA